MEELKNTKYRRLNNYFQEMKTTLFLLKNAINKSLSGLFLIATKNRP